MSCNTVLFEQRLLREVELQRVVGAQADIEACLEELRNRIPFIRKEQRIVAKRTHGNANLLEVEEVLQRGDLAQ